MMCHVIRALLRLGHSIPSPPQLVQEITEPFRRSYIFMCQREPSVTLHVPLAEMRLAKGRATCAEIGRSVCV